MSILVTGKNGQISKDIRDYFGNCFANQEIFYLGRSELDLTKKKQVDTFFKENKIDYILHTSILGGRRNKQDSYEDFYHNILMFNNVFSHIDKVKLFINFDSMASFDRRYPMKLIQEEEVWKMLPPDFYGLSKNLINRMGISNKFLNLRIFSCFSKNETDDRMIKGNILKCLKNEDVVIHQNRQMDFIHSDDVMRVIKYFLLDRKMIHNDFNICYAEKYTLLDIAQYIRKITNHQSKIIVENKDMAPPITGNNSRLTQLGIELKGLEEGISKVLKEIKGNYEKRFIDNKHHE